MSESGWVPFGTHAGDDPLPMVEFRGEGEDGLPLEERVLAPQWGDPPAPYDDEGMLPVVPEDDRPDPELPPPGVNLLQPQDEAWSDPSRVRNDMAERQQWMRDNGWAAWHRPPPKPPWPARLGIRLGSLVSRALISKPVLPLTRVVIRRRVRRDLRQRQDRIRAEAAEERDLLESWRQQEAEEERGR